MARAPKKALAAARTTPPAALPSITELGQVLGGIARREAAIDLMPWIGKDKPTSEEERSARAVEERLRMTADRLLFSQLDALRSIVSTMPAKTLSDCVVQVNVAGHLIMKITGNDLPKDELDELSDAIERIMVSVLPVMAQAAGLDLVEFAFDEVADLHEARFPVLAI